MSFDELLKSVKSFTLASELPDQFIGTIIDAQVEEVEKYGRQVQRIRVTIDIIAPEDYEGISTVTTWPKSIWPTVIDVFKKAGFSSIDEIIGTTWTFKRMAVGRVRFPRHIPIEYIGTEEEEEEEEPEPKPKPKRKSKSKKANPSGDIL